MTSDPNCFYCTRSQKLHDLMVEVVHLHESTVYLLKDQTHRGRCVVAYRDHRTELFQLSEAERNTFMKEVSAVAEAIYGVTRCDKVNYAVFGDGVPHFHVHIVPKKKDGAEWGKPFTTGVNTPTLLPETETTSLIRELKTRIEKSVSSG